MPPDRPHAPPTHANSSTLATSRPWLSVAGCLGGGVLAVLLAMILLIAAIVLLVFLPDLFTPSRRAIAGIHSALGALREAPALRVATREIAVRVDASVPTEAKLRAWIVPIGPGWKVEVGRTKVEVFAPANVVQYVVPMRVEGWNTADEIRAEIADDGAFIVTLPPPRVDEALVEVQSDPKALKIEVDRDWVDHVVRDEAARDAALAAIREAVVREASAELPMFEVRERARETVAEMIRALLPEDLRARPIRVRWSDENTDK